MWKWLNTLLFFSLFLAGNRFSNNLNAQQMDTDQLPYREIPEAPHEYSATNAVARMVDGLGYRYYWATEGLREVDLEYKISEDSRAAIETLDHVYGLSTNILNAAQSKVNEPNNRKVPADFEWLRRATLENLAEASQILKQASDSEIERFNVIFKRGEQETSYPFWNLINGMIADAIWHTGQIVSFRRASGNPIHPGVSVFRGITRE